MGMEIERKFLIHLDSMPAAILNRAVKEDITQGYVSLGTDTLPNVRVRLTERDKAPAEGTLTMKSPLVEGTKNSRKEWNIPMHADTARELLAVLPEPALLKKTRYIFPYGQHDLSWELDVFRGRNAGLVLAEIEIPSEDYPLILPDWIREEAPDIVNSKLTDKSWYDLWTSEHILAGSWQDMHGHLLALFGREVEEDAFWNLVNHSYACMKADPEVWAQEIAERKAMGI